ncbi:MarR family winged helix-turn-helix transcriptional regulator [Nocardioides zeae]|uniref:DNA-binding MarR family transcriptional regulator n=1 Tax=Nocardioides zeae TaxID=1457234 RepID=A0AAJ1U136_9ACTN|nr:MarR family transcriptional regulator [Nocardioides zeae]MDQ1105635.1 DNA-binding MarR family transcriptional regulator [Nocardioides zeae]
MVDHLTAPGHLLRRAQQVHTEAWSRIVSDVTGPQYAVLVAVDGWPGLDQKLAGELASLDKSTTAGIVSRLVAGGWIRRVEDPNDRRRRLLETTGDGAIKLPVLTAAARQVQAALLSPLSEPERETFVDLLGQVARLDDSPIVGQHVHDRSLVMARTPGYLIRRAQQLHTALWSDHVTDVTGPQYAVLAAVLRAGTATHAEIGTRASLDSSSVRDIVGRLTARGWLEAAPNAGDRRSRPVRVTAPAETAVRLLAGPVQGVQDELLLPLGGDDRTRFLGLAQRVSRVVDGPSRIAVA